jgi:hypothetical protein
MSCKITLAFIFLLLSCNVSYSQNINIDIDYIHPGIKIPDDFTGLSFETRAVVKDTTFNSGNTVLQNMIKMLGNGILRIGGNSVENSVFTLSKRMKSTGQDSITSDDIDRVFSFAKKTGWKVIFGLNLGKFDPELSALETQYAWKYKSQIHSFEIGNEPNHFIQHQTRDSSWGYPEFKTEFETYIKTINNLVPDAVFSGPATASKYNPWFVNFAKDESNNVCLLSHHHYPMSPEKGSVPMMLSKKLMRTISDLFLNLVKVSAEHNKKFRLAECNSVFKGGLAGVSNSFASALWGADFMFTLAQSGAVGLNIHTGATNAYTPISFSKGVYTAKPLFYGMMLFRLGNKGNFLPLKVSDTLANISCYAVKDSLGEVTFTIINKDSLANYSINVSFSGTSDFNSCDIIRLTAPSVYSTSDVSLAGDLVKENGTWMPKNIENVISDSKGNFILAVGAGSAASIHFLSPANVLKKEKR